MKRQVRIRNLEFGSSDTNKKVKNNTGITLVALVVTIVLNCSFLAMVVRV